MTIPSALLVLASLTTGSALQTAKTVTAPAPQPAFQQVPKGPTGLTLYNSKGEVVARCDKKDNSFSGCRMEPGVTLDDLMNAWVHAYQDSLKQN
jgi:hypothetical protein